VARRVVAVNVSGSPATSPAVCLQRGRTVAVGGERNSGGQAPSLRDRGTGTPLAVTVILLALPATAVPTKKT